MSEDFEWLLDNFKSKEDIAKGAPKIIIDRPDFETIDITSSDKENELEEDEIIEIVEVNEINVKENRAKLGTIEISKIKNKEPISIDAPKRCPGRGRKYSCPYCDKKYGNKNHLAMHLSMTHFYR